MVLHVCSLFVVVFSFGFCRNGLFMEYMSHERCLLVAPCEVFTLFASDGLMCAHLSFDLYPLGSFINVSTTRMYTVQIRRHYCKEKDGLNV